MNSENIEFVIGGCETGVSSRRYPGDERDYHMEVLEKPEIDCVDVINLLGDYCDQELTPTLVLRFEHHFDECRYCREMRDGYLKTVEAAKLLRDQPLPVDVQNRLREALNKKLGINLEMIKG